MCTLKKYFYNEQYFWNKQLKLPDFLPEWAIQRESTIFDAIQKEFFLIQIIVHKFSKVKPIKKFFWRQFRKVKHHFSINFISNIFFFQKQFFNRVDLVCWNICESIFMFEIIGHWHDDVTTDKPDINF